MAQEFELYVKVNLQQITFHQSGKMADFTEQRSAIKFCLKLQKNASETYQMMQQAYEEHCLSRGEGV